MKREMKREMKPGKPMGVTRTGGKAGATLAGLTQQPRACPA